MSDRIKVEPPELERRKPSAFFKDARIDRFITWLLGTVAVVGIGFVGNFVSRVEDGQVRIAKESTDRLERVAKEFADFKLDLNVKLATVASDIAVLKDERREIIDLKASLKTLEGRLHDLEVAKGR